MSAIPGLAPGAKGPALRWLGRRPAATAPIRPLAWEPPNVAEVAQRNREMDNEYVIYIKWNTNQQ